MRRTISVVITCLLLIGLALPSCTPGTGEEPLNLEPGGIVSGVDGVSVGAPEGALNQTIEIFIEKVDDPSKEVPFPEYLADAEVVGDFYAINARQDFSTPDDYLLLGLPVPEGISTDDLAFAVLVPPDSIMDEPDDSPSLRWIPLSGVYDPESGLFATLLPSVLTEFQVFGLVIGLSVDWTEGDLFNVASIGFGANESPEAHRLMTIDTLNAIHAACVTKMGFREPYLRNHVVYIRFGWPPVASVHGYEFQLLKGALGGFYDCLNKAAATTYPGAPDEPNPNAVHHELFHAIQYAYPALRANWPSWELGRTTEAVATAAELSLDGLTRSSWRLLGRDPMPVTRGLWSSSSLKPTSYDYAAQDLLVYLGKVIDPADPQLDFMIPWFERGGLVADLDAMLQADSTFNSLGDAYWQWAKNQAFEKQVILGPDWHGEAVPNGEACSWSGHGDRKDVFFSAETWTWGGDDTDFTLGPLTSRVFELTLNPSDSSYVVTSTIDSTDSDIEFKFYGGGEAGGEGCWNEARDSIPHTFHVGEEYVTGYLLVSNTNVETESDLISLVAAEKEPEYTAAIAFFSYRDGNADIYVMNSDGSGQINITHNPGDDWDPSWSPDGKKIVFQSWRDGNAEIYVMNADGSNQLKLTNDPAEDSHPDWSPDGTKIVFSSNRHNPGGPCDIYVMNADGSNPIDLTNSSGHNWYPAWSPDGTKIAFSSDRTGNYEIYVMDADGGNLRRLTSIGNCNQPSWSPDGSLIVFTHDSLWTRHIYVMSADGSNRRALTTGFMESNQDPNWSPGGKIVFASNQDGNFEIYGIDADGSNQTRLTFNGADDYHPAWGLCTG